MPTVERFKGFRFFFFSDERREPPHIHVESAENYAKFWLKPVALAESGGFHSAELTKLRKLVEERKERFLEEWNEYFDR
ncbi:MAG: DUF4160 domain-containing protein [Elusimicrobia bacterium]|nr:DUF4160 domain-containing protein [Elusimicrobiota bacterium]